MSNQLESFFELKEQFFETGSFAFSLPWKPGTLGKNLVQLQEGKSVRFNLAIIGVRDDRNTDNKGTAAAPDIIRAALYQLYTPYSKARVVDFGNLKKGVSDNDIYFALKIMVGHLMARNIIPIIIGGGNDLAFGQFLGYEDTGKAINLSVIDPVFDIEISGQIHARNFLNRIIGEYGKHLFNYSHLGYQKYLVSQADIDLMNRLFFDIYRLGELRNGINISEPVLRDTDMVSIDMGAIRQSDSPGHFKASPNGFYGEEVCQMAWYAGHSLRVKSFGLYEVNPSLDPNGMSSQLAAQIIWHFMDGYYQRKNNLLTQFNDKTSKYYVDVEVLKHKITFLHEEKNDLWWLEIPDDRGNGKETLIIACSKEDYLSACNGDVPDRLWRIYQKIS
jgi:formiminoglutamase